jgi:hypothetical protein
MAEAGNPDMGNHLGQSGASLATARSNLTLLSIYCSEINMHRSPNRSFSPDSAMGIA